MSDLNGYKVHIIDTDEDDKILVVQPTDTRRGNFGTLRTTLNNIDLADTCITNEKEEDTKKEEKEEDNEKNEKEEDHSNDDDHANKRQKSNDSTIYKIVVTEHAATSRNTHQIATPTMVITTTGKALRETNTMKLINEYYDNANISIDTQDPDSKDDKDALQSLLNRANTDPLTTVAKYGDDDKHKIAYIHIST